MDKKPSFQKQVNATGVVNWEILEPKIKENLENGWVEIEGPFTKDKFQSQYNYKYIGEEWKDLKFTGRVLFRSGGICAQVENEYMVLKSNGLGFSVQFNRLKRVWGKKVVRRKKKLIQ